MCFNNVQYARKLIYKLKQPLDIIIIKNQQYQFI